MQTTNFRLKNLVIFIQPFITVMVALQNGEVRIYKDKYLVNMFKAEVRSSSLAIFISLQLFVCCLGTAAILFVMKLCLHSM